MLICARRLPCNVIMTLNLAIMEIFRRHHENNDYNADLMMWKGIKCHHDESSAKRNSFANLSKWSIQDLHDVVLTALVSERLINEPAISIKTCNIWNIIPIIVLNYTYQNVSFEKVVCLQKIHLVSMRKCRMTCTAMWKNNTHLHLWYDNAVESCCVKVLANMSRRKPCQDIENGSSISSSRTTLCTNNM